MWGKSLNSKRNAVLSTQIAYRNQLSALLSPNVEDGLIPIFADISKKNVEFSGSLKAPETIVTGNMFVGGNGVPGDLIIDIGGSLVDGFVLDVSGNIYVSDSIYEGTRRVATLDYVDARLELLTGDGLTQALNSLQDLADSINQDPNFASNTDSSINFLRFKLTQESYDAESQTTTILQNLALGTDFSNRIDINGDVIMNNRLFVLDDVSFSGKLCIVKDASMNSN